MSFSHLGLSEKVLAAVEASGYTTPTPIQAQAIPHVMQRRDVLGIAQTGTGKTAAFTLPMLTLLEQGRARARMPRTLILEPTRELAAQVEENFTRYGAKSGLSVALLIGGVSFGDQDVKITRGVDVLIATPGRLLDHFERGKLLLGGVELLVIDEADRMLDMGFIPDIERICKLVPFTRQTLFFTATMPPEIQRITDQFLHNPIQIEASRPATAATTIVQALVHTRSAPVDKRETLRHLIRSAERPQERDHLLQSQDRGGRCSTNPSSATGFAAVALHGDMDQRSRMAALESFRNGEMTLLVASDVAARGLDIPDVSHVFNFDVPLHADDYVHRIGRTGRAGRAGAAISIVTPLDQKSIVAIEKLIGQDIPRAEGNFDIRADATDRGDQPRAPRERDGARRGRKPHADKAHQSKPHQEKPHQEKPHQERSHQDKPHRDKASHREREAKPASTGRSHGKPAPASPQLPPSFGRVQPRRVATEADAEPADHSHLPAFLLRPVRTTA